MRGAGRVAVLARRMRRRGHAGRSSPSASCSRRRGSAEEIVSPGRRRRVGQVRGIRAQAMSTARWSLTRDPRRDHEWHPDVVKHPGWAKAWCSTASCSRGPRWPRRARPFAPSRRLAARADAAMMRRSGGVLRVRVLAVEGLVTPRARSERARIEALSCVMMVALWRDVALESAEGSSGVRCGARAGNEGTS